MAMDGRLSMDIMAMLMTNLDACIVAAQTAKAADMTYYHAVFNGCAGISGGDTPPPPPPPAPGL